MKRSRKVGVHFREEPRKEIIGDVISRVLKDDPLPLYVAFGVFSFWSWLRLTMFFPDGQPTPADQIESYVQLVTCALIAFRFLTIKTSPARRAISLILALFGVILWIRSREGWILWSLLFIAAGKDVSIKRIAEITAFSCLSVTLLAVIGSGSGLIENVVAARSDNGVVRVALGFQHPNSLGAALVTAVIAIYIAVNGRMARFVAPVLNLAAIYIVMFIARSKTSALILFMTLVSVILASFIRRVGKSRSHLYVLLFVSLAMMGLSIFFLYNFDANIALHEWLDGLLSGRLSLAKAYFVRAPLTLFGNSYSGVMEWNVDGVIKEFVVDNVYDHAIMRFGIVLFTMFVVAFIALYAFAIRRACLVYELTLFAVFIAMGFAEILALQIHSDFLLFLFSTLIYSSHPLRKSSESGGTCELGCHSSAMRSRFTVKGE